MKSIFLTLAICAITIMVYAQKKQQQTLPVMETQTSGPKKYAYTMELDSIMTEEVADFTQFYTGDSIYLIKDGRPKKLGVDAAGNLAIQDCRIYLKPELKGTFSGNFTTTDGKRGIWITFSLGGDTVINVPFVSTGPGAANGFTANHGGNTSDEQRKYVSGGHVYEISFGYLTAPLVVSSKADSEIVFGKDKLVNPPKQQPLATPLNTGTGKYQPVPTKAAQ